MKPPRDAVRRRWLAGVGQHAEIAPDAWVPGAWVLSIGGAEQSHVDLQDPGEIFYEYLRRLANHLDVMSSPGAPLKVLHLGAGALTLARYLAATRPGSEQVAVDSERELLGFVLECLPLADPEGIRTIIADAREVLHQELSGEHFDAVVLDVFAGPDAPEHLRAPAFHAEIQHLLAPGGIALINVGDDPPLDFVRQQLGAMEATYQQVTLAAPTELLGGRFPGNFILMGTDTPWDAERIDALIARGPHPGTVLTGTGLDRFRKP